jgi:predicted nucleotidyltransferase
LLIAGCCVLSSGRHINIGLREDLTALFGRRVDLLDWGAARNPYFRKQAESEAVELYGA